jgi:hypothetical protein
MQCPNYLSSKRPNLRLKTRPQQYIHHVPLVTELYGLDEGEFGTRTVFVITYDWAQ